MKKINHIIIDGLEYIIVKRIENYIFLVELDEPENFFIHKAIKEGINEKLVPLDNEEEYKKALEMFQESK